MAETERWIDVSLSADDAFVLLRVAGEQVAGFSERSADEVSRRVRWHQGLGLFSDPMDVVATVTPSDGGCRVLFEARNRKLFDAWGHLDGALLDFASGIEDRCTALDERSESGPRPAVSNRTDPPPALYVGLTCFFGLLVAMAALGL